MSAALTRSIQGAIDSALDVLGALRDAKHWSERDATDGRVWHAVQTAYDASVLTAEQLAHIERKHAPDRPRAGTAGGRGA